MVLVMAAPKAGESCVDSSAWIEVLDIDTLSWSAGSR
jgi:hypothetical protein